MIGSFTRRGLLPLSAALAGAGLTGNARAAVAGTLGRTGGDLPAGVYRVDADMMIDADLKLAPGATIDIAAGATLRIRGHFDAPAAHVFTGSGRVDINQSRTPHARPEWWGAAPGDGGRDSLPAMRACLAAHPVMLLLPADYHLSGTLIVDRPFSRITGAGHRGTAGWQGTRLVLDNGRGDVLRVGPDRRPASVNDFPQNIEIRAIALCRAMAVDGSTGRQPVGLRAQYLLYARFEQVSAAEHATSFHLRGLVRSHLVDCIAFRSIPGVQAGLPWRGFLLDGMDDIGLAGGNASLFLTDCNATIGGDPQVGDAVGLLLEGAFADSFITRFEATAIATGIRVDGKTGQIGGRARAGQVNLHLHMPVIDQCGDAGIVIRDTGPDMMIDIADLYVAASPAARAAIQCAGLGGSLAIIGGQLVGGSNSAAGGSAVGLLADDSAGLQVQGIKILDHPIPVQLSRCTGFTLQGWIANPNHVTGRDAVMLRDCARGGVTLLIGGRDGAFAGGVQIDGGAHHLRIDATGHDDAALAGGAQGRVRLRGRAIAIPYRDQTLLVDGA
ncbi:hypothetical protein [Sphingobium sp. CAP-1]|uniref:hypothetical protein n=1 Tax=Sphingobium sp. CAP-1 TaxID=2676077 RepID=UPI0012BB47B8|nr:hypothetical protein [Sphingobium sp. CAP-1]QGP79715.1 hypothetical protein GL174_12570 [Sphingobium sp. CAP-1]